MLGSIGVAAGVRVFVREKLDSVAMLRSIGARPRDVVAVYSGLAICLGLAAGTLGVLLCLPLVAVLPGMLGDLLPVEIRIRVGPAAIATGLGLSVPAPFLWAVFYAIFVGVNIAGVELTFRVTVAITALALAVLAVFWIGALPHFSWEAALAVEPSPGHTRWLPSGWQGVTELQFSAGLVF